MVVKLCNRRSVALRIRCSFKYEIMSLPGHNSLPYPSNILAPGDQLVLNTSRDMLVDLTNDELLIEIV